MQGVEGEAKRLEWASSVPEAREIQRRLRNSIVFEPPNDFHPQLVAGCDVAFDRARNLAFAAVVVLDLETLATVETATCVEPIRFPYVPGYLSFRELPVLVSTWKRLSVEPEVAVLDAHGYAHPRRMGLASHAGLEFGIPTVGCAKSILVGELATIGSERGDTSDLSDPKTGEVIGWALRTRPRVRPVYLSIGHLMDLPTARELVLRLTPGGRYRFPETTRRADRLAGDLKRTT